jgi:hypothetical protein
MTEREWLEAIDPYPMLEHLCRQQRMTRVKAGRRKLRLFSCACCRQSLEDRRLQAALELTERYADGDATKKELAQARAGTEKVAEALNRATAEADSPALRTAWLLSRAVAEAAGDEQQLEVGVRLVLSQTGLAARAATGEGDAGLAALQALYRRQCDLLRCLFGNPSRALPAIKKAWLRWNGSVVLRLAEAAYAERVLPAGTLDPTRLAILADALEDAGANHEVVLQHLRSPGPHVPGCFAVDAVLGRA